MNYAEIKECDIANGVGVRTTLFVSGCRHHCVGCFNAEAWDFSAGQPFTKETEDRIIASLRPEYVNGLSILGGEPLEPENQAVLAPFLERVRSEVPSKDIWMWTGFVWDDLVQGHSRARTQSIGSILSLLDVLVDGPFLEEQKDLLLRFRGSANQRIIHVPSSLEQGDVVIWRDERIFASHAW